MNFISHKSPLIEYLTEFYFFLGLKEYWWISNLSLAINIIRDIIRKLTIVTVDQQLVTNEIYRFVWYLNYCGFFIWSVGIQILCIFSGRIS
uniref:Protein-S-isoprenylcysteine O-methyltransferase n=1 Tax=Solanum lycopersicum TaxID=4081 RepID=A0A3Q7HBY9_SOLLC